MSRLAFVAALLRPLRVDRWPAAVLVVVVFASALLVAAAPRLLNRVADEGLRHEVARASAPERNVVFTRLDRLGDQAASADPLGDVEREGQELLAGLPEPVGGLVGRLSTVVDSVRYTIVQPPSLPGFMNLRWQSGIDDGALRYVSGRSPQGLSDAAAPDLGGPAAGRVPVVEVALPATSAELLGLEVGDVVALTPDPADAAVPSFGSQFPIAVEVVGIYEVVDPGDERWFEDPSLAGPIVIRAADPWIVYATAVFDPAALSALRREPVPLRHTWRLHVDAGRLDADGLPEVIDELRRLETAYPAFAGNLGDGLSMRTGLTGLLGRYLGQRVATEGLLAVTAAGPLAIGLGALVVLGRARAGRRAASATLARSRGASLLQLGGAHVAEAALLAVPAATLGYLAARLAVDARESVLSQLGAATVAAVAVVVLAATGLARDPGTGPSDAAPTGRASRRLVAEGTIVAIAVAGILLLRERGILGGSVAGDLTSVDPFLAGVPVLAGLAVGIVTLRLYPLPIRGLAWLAALRRDLVPALAMWRIGRRGAGMELPLLVVLLTLGVGSFASVMLTTIERGQDEAAWAAVGADFRVEPGGSGLLSQLALEAVPGVEAAADWHVAADARRGDRSFGGQQVGFVALDAPAHAAVTAGTPIDARLPAALLAPPPPAGTADAPLPAVVSARQPADLPGLTVGDTFEIWIHARSTLLQVVEVRDEFAGLPAGSSFVVVSLDQFRAARPGAAFDPTRVMVRAPASAGQAIAGELSRQIESARLVSREQRRAALADAPLVGAVRAGFAAALGVAAGFAVLTMLLAVGLNAAARRREEARLAAMGLSRGQLLALTVLEQVPPLLVTCLAGAALGLGMAWLLAPGLGLSTYVGITGEVAPRVDPLQLAALGAVLLVVAGGAVGAGLVAAGRRRLAAEVRVTDA